MTGSTTPAGQGHEPGEALRPHPPPPSESLRFLSTLTTLLLSADTVDDVLSRVIFAARHTIPGADLVSITLREDDGDLRTPVQTAREAAELDHLQYRSGEGPCVDAADPDGPAYALSADLAHDDAWPDFAAAATAHGYASVLSTALVTDPGPAPFTGALNIYSRSLGGLDADARDLAFLLATQASLALAGAHAKEAVADGEERRAKLRKALDTRAVIGQATGILMSRRGLTAEQAFEVLSRTSQNHNIKLNRLAEQLAAKPYIADRLPD